MDPNLKAIVEGLDDEQRRRIETRDLLLSAFRVTAAGVDVTRWSPQLPSEIEKAKRRRRHKRP